MKKVIELLEKARENTAKGIADNPLYAATKVCYNANLLLNEALGILKAAPRWETPEQYKERTGKAWPDENAVYRLYTDNDGIAKWYAESYKGRTRPNDRYKLLPVVCATEAGPPPEDWKPEGGGK